MIPGSECLACTTAQGWLGKLRNIVDTFPHVPNRAERVAATQTSHLDGQIFGKDLIKPLLSHGDFGCLSHKIYIFFAKNNVWGFKFLLREKYIMSIFTTNVLEYSADPEPFKSGEFFLSFLS